MNGPTNYLLGFSFYINIANFEVFLKVRKLSANLFFLKSKDLKCSCILTHPRVHMMICICSIIFFPSRSQLCIKMRQVSSSFFSHVSSLFLSSPCYKTCCFFPIFRYFFLCVEELCVESRQNQSYQFILQSSISLKKEEKNPEKSIKKFT